MSEDRATLFVAMENSARVRRISISNGALGPDIELPPPARQFGMRLSRGGGHLFVTAGQPDGSIYIVELDTGSVRALYLAGRPRRIAFSADGEWAFLSNENGWVDVLR